MRTWIRTTSLVGLALLLPSAGGNQAASQDPDRLPPIVALGSDCDGDGVADVDEIAADPTIDSNGNGQLDLCEGLSVDRLQVSLSEGGVQRLSIDLDPAFGGRLYWMLGTTAGTDPGFQLGFAKVPLNSDGEGGYLQQSMLHPNKDELEASLGILNAHGDAEVRFVVPPGSDASLAGTVIHHAYVLVEISSRKPMWASNWVSVELVP